MFQSYNHGLHCLTVGHKAPLFNVAWLAWLTNQALGVWRLDNAIYQIKPYLVKRAIRFSHTCQLDSNLSIFLYYPPSEQLGTDRNATVWPDNHCIWFFLTMNSLGWEIWDGSVKSLQWNTSVISLIMKVLKVNLSL